MATDDERRCPVAQERDKSATQRRQGQGKRGGYRTIVAFRLQDRAVFLFGFAKSDAENVERGEVARLARVGARYLRADDQEIEDAIIEEELVEVDCGDEEEEG